MEMSRHGNESTKKEKILNIIIYTTLNPCFSLILKILEMHSFITPTKLVRIINLDDAQKIRVT